MAGASAKKAAAARQSASSTYFPLVLGINVLHALVRLYHWQTFAASTTAVVLNVVMIILTVVAYNGILDDHATSSSSSAGKGKDTKLAGGPWLDVLGLVIVVQFGSALVSDAFYGALLMLPLGMAYRTYSTVRGAREGLMGGGGSGSGGYGGVANGEQGGGAQDAAEERRRKRSERRRMKRAG